MLCLKELLLRLAFSIGYGWFWLSIIAMKIASRLQGHWRETRNNTTTITTITIITNNKTNHPPSHPRSPPTKSRPLILKLPNLYVHLRIPSTPLQAQAPSFSTNHQTAPFHAAFPLDARQQRRAKRDRNQSEERGEGLYLYIPPVAYPPPIRPRFRPVAEYRLPRCAIHFELCGGSWWFRLRRSKILIIWVSDIDTNIKPLALALALALLLPASPLSNSPVVMSYSKYHPYPSYTYHPTYFFPTATIL